MRLRLRLLAMTTWTAALVGGGPVYAQSIAPPKGGVTSGVSPAAGFQGRPATVGTAPESSGIAEVVVTAQKRTENVQKTPAAITAITGVALTQSGLTDIRKVQEVVPGARFQQEGNSTQVFLRGVGSNLDVGNIEPSVSFNFNGIFIPREGTSVPLFDIERLEVLPGPQGTLYGRSAIGGTVNINFQRPTQVRETIGVLELGNYNLGHISLAENMPVTGDLAIRAAVDYTYRTGYMTSGADSQNDLAGRLSLLWTPTEALKIYLWAYDVQKYGHPANLVNKGYDPVTDAFRESSFLHNGNPWDDSRQGPFAALAPFGQPKAPTQTYDNWALGGQIDYKLNSSMTLTYIPGIFYLNAETRDYWLGAIPDDEGQHYHEVTQELRLSGAVSKIDYLVGLYGYQVINGGEARLFPGLPIAFDASHVIRNQLEGLALFGQSTVHLSDQLRLTLGGRYGSDNRNGFGISLLDQVTPYHFAKTFYHADFKVGVEYDVAPRILSYANIQTGYQPGTYNEVAATTQDGNLVRDAKLTAYSGGLKTRLFDNHVQINDEFFYYDYTNLFIQAYDASKSFNPIFNAKKVTIPGNQLDTIFKPSDNDRLVGSVSYTHARNKNFVTPSGQSYDGLSPPYAADWTASIAYFHDFHFSAGYIRAGGDARYESEFFADYVHNLGVKQSAAVKENVDLTYYPNRANWTLGFWIKNISNIAVIAATAAAGIPGPATAYLEPPRTFGGRLTFKY